MVKHEVLDFSGTEPTMDDLERISQAWVDDLLVLDNHAVFALGGNGNNSNLQQRIVDVKGGQRGVLQPVGWTRPFDERSLPTIDVNRIESRPMRRLLEDPDTLNKALGGLAFLRATANMQAKEDLGIPDSIIAPLTKEELADGKTSTVQIYSPAGVRYTEELVHIVISKDGEPVMSSANRSSQPESTTKAAALDFVNTIEFPNQPPALTVVWQDDTIKRSLPGGSYAIIEVKRDHLELVRAGCLGMCVLRAVLPDYPLIAAPDLKPANFANQTLRLADLPPELRWLKGPELNLGLLAHHDLSSRSVRRV